MSRPRCDTGVLSMSPWGWERKGWRGSQYVCLCRHTHPLNSDGPHNAHKSTTGEHMGNPGGKGITEHTHPLPPPKHAKPLGVRVLGMAKTGRYVLGKPAKHPIYQRDAAL
jgi:hypothetical protein